MSELTLRFRIGVFVLASLLLLAVLIILFGSFPRVLTPSNEYAVRFVDAPGISVGTPVRRSGVRVGEVRAIDLDDETGEVRVQILVNRRFTIRRNDQPTLVHGLFGGDTTIDFVPRREGAADADRTPVEPGSELMGTPQATVNTLLNRTSDMVPVAGDALKEIRDSLQRVDKLAPLLEDTVREYRKLAEASTRAVPDIQKAANKVSNLAETTQQGVQDLKQTNEDIRRLVKPVRESLDELKKTATEAQVTLRTWDKLGERLRLLVQTNEESITRLVNGATDTLARISNILTEENQRHFNTTLKNVAASSEQLDSITKNTDLLLKESLQTVKQLNGTLTKTDEVLGTVQQAAKPLADRTSPVMKNLDEASGRINRVLIDVQALFKTIDQGDGTLRRLITDPALYNHIDQAAVMVLQMLPRMDRVLRDVEVFSDKIARHPEALGIGGAVRPSSGLKESPSLPPLPWGKPPGY
jgi:ABC-type transporter Mla subunit MlaD